MHQLLVADGEAGLYVDWGVLHISGANLAIIAAMLVLFVLALVLPFPRPRRSRGSGPR